MELSGRAFIVTGAASGIGRELSRALRKADARVALVDRRADLLPGLADELGGPAFALPLGIDLGIAGQPSAAVDGAAAHFGRLDGLINNAAVFVGGDVACLEPALFRHTLEVNVMGLVESIQRALPHLRCTRGVVVNLSSKAAALGLPHIAAYSASKAAVTALSEALRRELLPDGVRVLVVYPGFTRTHAWDNALGGWQQIPDKNSRIIRPRSAAHAADDIVRAIRANRSEFWAATLPERIALAGYTLARTVAPRMVDRAVLKLL